MTKSQKSSLFILRIVLGWLYFYAGITKVLNPAWSAGGYLEKAKTFPDFYHWLAGPSILPVINFLNAWGLTLIGAALILGVFVRLSSFSAIILMVLYYLPVLDFPYPNTNFFIVDEHIIFIGALIVLAVFRAGRAWGLENWCANLPLCRKFPKLREWLG